MMSAGSRQDFHQRRGTRIGSSMPGIHDVPFLTNSSMMDVDFLPEHLVVVGGSYVGLEFAQMYRRFGSEVTIVEMGPRLIGREDEDVSEAVREILEAEGIQDPAECKMYFVPKRDSGVAVGTECDKGRRSFRVPMFF